PDSVPASGSTVSRTRDPMRRKTSSQSAVFRSYARPEPLENLGSIFRRRRRLRSTTMVMRYGCCMAHTCSMSCGVGRRYGAAPPEGGSLVAPQQRSGHVEGTYVREPLPSRAAGAEVGAVIVEGSGQTARPGQRPGEVIDDGLRHRLRVGTDREHQAQPAVVVLGQHLLGLAFHEEQPDVAGARLLV